MYLSINHMCFYSFLMGAETILIVRWSDLKVRQLDIEESVIMYYFFVQRITRQSAKLGENIILENCNGVTTCFSMFINIDETQALMEQLTKVAITE